MANENTRQNSPNYVEFSKMLKFLRKVRLELIKGKGINNYLFYAISEIFLVVVGILIALQINNWNERNKERSREILYLNEILREIRGDSTYYAFWINAFKEQEHSAKLTLSVLENSKQVSIDTLEFLTNFANSYMNIMPDRTPVIWTELKSTGGLSLFRNRALVKELTAYYNLIDSYIKIKESDFNVDFNNARLYHKEVFNSQDAIDFFEDFQLDTLRDASVIPGLLNDRRSLTLLRRIMIVNKISSYYLNDLQKEAAVMIKELEADLIQNN